MKGIEKRILVSSYGIAGVQANDIYMAIRVKMLSDRRNLNQMRVTAAFIHQIVADRAMYIGTPLVVDRYRLENGQYTRLTHLQDADTGEFSTEQIGSFVDFEAEQEADGELALIGTARIEKRFERACAAIRELYERDQLCVSYEIIVDTYLQTPNEIVIDAAEGNSLIGMCIVSLPAYEDARALALVASTGDISRHVPEDKKEKKDREKEEPMEDKESRKPEVQPEKEAPPEVHDPNRRATEAEEPDNELERLREEMASLKAANEQLAQFKTRWEAAEKARLEAEKQERQRCLSELVSTVGLTVDDHRESIEQLDYPVLVPLLLETLKHPAQPEPSVMPCAPMIPAAAAVNGLVQQNGVRMSGSQPDHPYRGLVRELTM